MQVTPEDLEVFKTKQTSIAFEFSEFTLGEEKNDWTYESGAGVALSSGIAANCEA
jgi:hypothetical protein